MRGLLVFDAYTFIIFVIISFGLIESTFLTVSNYNCYIMCDDCDARPLNVYLPGSQETLQASSDVTYIYPDMQDPYINGRYIGYFGEYTRCDDNDPSQYEDRDGFTIEIRCNICKHCSKYTGLTGLINGEIGGEEFTSRRIGLLYSIAKGIEENEQLFQEWDNDGYTNNSNDTFIVYQDGDYNSLSAEVVFSSYAFHGSNTRTTFFNVDMGGYYLAQELDYNAHIVKGTETKTSTNSEGLVKFLNNDSDGELSYSYSDSETVTKSKSFSESSTQSLSTSISVDMEGKDIVGSLGVTYGRSSSASFSETSSSTFTDTNSNSDSTSLEVSITLSKGQHVRFSEGITTLKTKKVDFLCIDTDCTDRTSLVTEETLTTKSYNVSPIS